jgi:hypothetical protein
MEPSDLLYSPSNDSINKLRIYIFNFEYGKYVMNPQKIQWVKTIKDIHTWKNNLKENSVIFPQEKDEEILLFRIFLRHKKPTFIGFFICIFYYWVGCIGTAGLI